MSSEKEVIVWQTSAQMASAIQSLNYKSQKLHLQDLQIKAVYDQEAKKLTVLATLDDKSIPLTKLAISLLGRIAGVKVPVLKATVDDEDLLQKVVAHCLKQRLDWVHWLLVGYTPDSVLHFADEEKPPLEFVRAVLSAVNASGHYFIPSLLTTGEFQYLAMAGQPTSDPVYGAIHTGYIFQYAGGIKLARLLVYSDRNAWFRSPLKNLRKSKKDPFSILNQQIPQTVASSSELHPRWLASNRVVDDPHKTLWKLADTFGMSVQVYNLFAADVALDAMPALDVGLKVAEFAYQKQSPLWQEFAMYATNALTGNPVCATCGAPKI